MATTNNLLPALALVCAGTAEAQAQRSKPRIPRTAPQLNFFPAAAALVGGSDACATPDVISGTGNFAFDNTSATIVKIIHNRWLLSISKFVLPVIRPRGDSISIYPHRPVDSILIARRLCPNRAVRRAPADVESFLLPGVYLPKFEPLVGG